MTTLSEPAELSDARAAETTLREVTTRSTVRSYRIVQMHGTHGTVGAYHYAAKPPGKAVLYLGCVRDGFESPAFNLYKQVAEDMQARRVSGLRIRLRKPEDLRACLDDVILGMQFLRTQGHGEMALAAYSHAAVPAVHAARTDPAVSALALFSPQFPDSGITKDLPSEGRVLFVHGGRDTAMPLEQARQAYDNIRANKEFITLPLSRHSLDENSSEALLKFRAWLQNWRTAPEASPRMESANGTPEKA